MKKSLLAFCAVFVCSCAFATLQYKVANVEAHQRYPWNGKVDIDFTIDCEDKDAEFKVTFGFKNPADEHTYVEMKTIRNNDKGESSTEFTLKAGTYRFTWDADVDKPNVKLSRISFVVYATYLGPTEIAEYLVIDLSGGTNATKFAVSTMNGVPADGWNDEYTTTKLVLRRCPSGADPLGRYTLTKDFYVGVFEVTQKQWELVMGRKEDSWTKWGGKGDRIPAYGVSYDDIRGSGAGADWPSSSEVDADSFIGVLRAKTGLKELDLPTEAQWEYACRAGTTTTYNTGDDEAALAASGWYLGNDPVRVSVGGIRTPNAWGLYDMHGNVCEWCLDWDGGTLTNNDPVGAESGSYRCVRGGGRYAPASNVTSSYRSHYSASYGGGNGVRLCKTVP